MSNHATPVLAVAAALLLAGAIHAQSKPSLNPGASDSPAAGLQHFLATKPGARVVQSQGRIERIYGAAFSNGPSALASAEAFRVANARVFGAEPQDLVASAPAAGAPHVQQLMYDRATGKYKFSAVYYSQVKAGIPVFGARLVLLARNETNFPLVLASSSLRNLAGFHPAGVPAGRPNAAAAQAAAAGLVGPAPRFTPARYVIWAGVDDIVAQPTVAIQFVAESGRSGSPTHQKLLVIADPATGRILHTEDQILHGEAISGHVDGNATTGFGADICGPELPAPLPYLQVNGSSTFTFTNATGDYSLPVCCTTPTTLTAGLQGEFFDVYTQQGTDSILTVSAAAPGPANFLFNAPNDSEIVRAQVNAYLHTNVVRDFALGINPAYPVIGPQLDFPVNVNINDTCNAGYDGESINFFHSGGGCTNTANSTVVYHEYGHHLVQVGGSGQGAYGEGMGDCMGVLITDQPQLGVGFHEDCSEPLRNADNDMQYPCAGEIHFCGTLISGCVWSTRNELAATNPSTYRDILNNLTLNSILVHNGSSITPTITLDFLTLDDDDADLTNGTPHYAEIAAGFGAHSMGIASLEFSFPNGLPAFVGPAGGTTVRFVVEPVLQPPLAGSGRFFVNVGAGFVPGTVNQISPNVYDAVFPASPCSTAVSYYFSAEGAFTSGTTSPAGAPTSGSYVAISAFGAGTPVFADDGETNPGWTVADSAGLDSGSWERGVPAGDGSRGDPPFDADGSGSCWLTQNEPGDSDVDGGTTTLTSPVMNASGGEKLISYYRWYSNTQGGDPMDDTFVVQVSSNGGTSWVDLETVGPAGPEVDGGWFHKHFVVSDFVPLTSQFRIRFRASDLGGGSIIEAGVDGIKLEPLVCTSAFADLNGDGHINGLDLAILLGLWTGGATAPGCPPSPAADLNGDCRINGLDLALLLGVWTG